MLRQFGLILLTSLVTSLIAACSTVPEKDNARAELHLKIGTALLNQGQYPAALSELLKAEKLDSSNPVIQNNLGLAYFVRSRFDLAEKHIQRALRLNPKYTDARNNLGRLLIEQKKYKDAIKELKIATQDLTYTEPSGPLLNLGHAYYLSENFEAAQKTLIEALGYKRQNCFGMTLYGQTLFKMRKYPQATEAFDEAVRVCDSAAKEEPYYFSALSYLKLGQRSQAYARLKEYLDSFPKGTYSAKVKNLMREIQ